jgi:hypothetical protein
VSPGVREDGVAGERGQIRVRSGTDGYSLVGAAPVVESANEFLRYLADRN